MNYPKLFQLDSNQDTTPIIFNLKEFHLLKKIKIFLLLLVQLLQNEGIAIFSFIYN